MNMHTEFEVAKQSLKSFYVLMGMFPVAVVLVVLAR